MTSNGRWHPKIHNSLFSRVTVRDVSGQPQTLSRFLEDFMLAYPQGDVPGCPINAGQRRWVRIDVHSPVLPMVTDSQGRRFGIDAQGTLHDEIPLSYIDPGHPWSMAVPALDGALTIDYALAYPFDYGIDVLGLLDGLETSKHRTQGSAGADFILKQQAVVSNTPQAVIINMGGASTNPPRLMNLSTRGQVSTGDNVMIGGFIISGAGSKKLLIRAVGPNLVNYGVTGVLANPMIELHRSTDGAIVASNDDWGSAANAAEVAATTLAPVDAKEAAILTTLDPGAYTAIITGNGGGTGVGIFEVYELDRPEAPLLNISTRGSILTGDKQMIGGFIIQGDAPKTVLIWAVGPTLANYGVSGTIANPTLELHKSSDGSIVSSNDDWGSAANAAAITATGLAPQNASESAILITLQPGAYTAVVSGKNRGHGRGHRGGLCAVIPVGYPAPRHQNQHHPTALALVSYSGAAQ